MPILSKCATRNEYWVGCNLCGGKTSNVYGTHAECDDRTLPVLRIIFRGKGQRIDLCPNCVRKLGAQLDQTGVSLGGVVELAMREAAMDPPEKCHCVGDRAQRWCTQVQSWCCVDCKGWVDPTRA